MDAGWTLGGRCVDAGWTLGGRWVDGGWTMGGRWVDGTKKNGNGRWTGWSRKVDGMVTEAGRDGHGKWSKTKDLLYLPLLTVELALFGKK